MRFSIIVPLYNKAAYIAKALQSVFDQTFKDWELIVVDDGSTDNSLDVAKQVLECSHSNLSPFTFHLLSQKNAGVSTARNNGVAASYGDYICFLDADDWWSPTFLEEINLLINDYPDAGIYGTSFYIVKNGKSKVAPIAFDKGFERGFIDYLKVYSRRLCMPLWTGAVCLKKSIFDEMNGFKPQLRLGEDFDLWLRISLNYKVVVVNKQLAYYNWDVDLANRAIAKLHNPETTEMLFYDEYEKYCAGNVLLKELLDKKRVYGLYKYYMDKQYHTWAKSELDKVDWTKQPYSEYRKYKTPLILLKIKDVIMGYGSMIKQIILK